MEVSTMSLQVNLKLKLSKILKKITVKYNTFEKATYDEYLIASLVLNSKSKSKAFDYIDEITGAGSLNSHFKKLYDKISSFTDEQLERIMESSMFPILKIDKSNSYEYYPQLDISVFHKHVYNGDIANLDNLLELLYIKEDVLELQVNDGKTIDKSEPYTVAFDNNGNISVRVLDRSITIDSELFDSLLDVELDSIEKYQGFIHNKADGKDWNTLNNLVINSLFSTNNYLYDADGNHLLIRNENVRRTEVAKMSGLYIYRQSNVPYEKNPLLCERVLDVIKENGTYSMFKPQLFVKLLNNVELHKTVGYINDLYLHSTSMPRDIALLSINLLRQGILTGWMSFVLDAILEYCSTKEYNLIYRANSNVKFSIDQLIVIDRSLLTDKHRKQVDEYFDNINKMKATIKEITGDITTSGLREAVKKLVSDEKTKRFSKLCNNLIGHVAKGLDSASLNEIKQWSNDAIELKELGVIMKRKINS